MSNRAFTPEQVIAAVRAAGGNQSDAARMLKCNRETIRRAALKYATVREAIDEANETALDFSESQLMELIREKNITAIIFHLKTKGKKRGYVERVEQTGADGAAVQVIVRYADE